MKKLLGIALIVSTVATILAPPAAGALRCNEEEQFFWRNTTDRLYQNGGRNQIYLRNRNLAPASSCPNSRTVSTVHIERDATYGTVSGDQVEIGWKERWNPDNALQKQWVLFYEKQSFWNVTDAGTIYAPAMDLGTYDIFRIDGYNDGPDKRWVAEVNFLTGGGWVHVYTFRTTWQQSVAMAETERFAEGSAMTDEQINLQFKNDSGQWIPWKDIMCIQHRKENMPIGDYSYAYRWTRTSNNSFTVTQPGNTNAC